MLRRGAEHCGCREAPGRTNHLPSGAGGIGGRVCGAVSPSALPLMALCAAGAREPIETRKPPGGQPGGRSDRSPFQPRSTAVPREVSARQRAPAGRRRIAVPIFRDSGIFPIGLLIPNSRTGSISTRYSRTLAQSGPRPSIEDTTTTNSTTYIQKSTTRGGSRR